MQLNVPSLSELPLQSPMLAMGQPDTISGLEPMLPGATPTPAEEAAAAPLAQPTDGLATAFRELRASSEPTSDGELVEHEPCTWWQSLLNAVFVGFLVLLLPVIILVLLLHVLVLGVATRPLPEWVIRLLSLAYNGRLAVMLHGRLLPQPLLEELAARNPRAALEFVPDRLPQPLLEELAEREPGHALEHVADRLPQPLLRELARLDPKAAFEFAADRMPLALLEELATQMPELALRYAADRLSLPVLTELARQAPQAALDHAAHRLSSAVVAELQQYRDLRLTSQQNQAGGVGS